MGMSPDQVDACALWKFTAAFRGWKRANSPEQQTKSTLSEQEATAFGADLGLEGF